MTTVSDAAGNTHTIESSAVQAKLLDMMKQAADTDAEITVTENGYTLLRLTVTKPKIPNPKKPFLDADRHLLISYGDIISPIDEDWEAKFDKKWDEKLGTT